MYAPTPEQNQVAVNRFVNSLAEVNVRQGSKDANCFQPATDYYFKNWQPHSEKWMFVERKGIPGLDDENTNNRLERLWRSMKGWIIQF